MVHLQGTATVRFYEAHKCEKRDAINNSKTAISSTDGPVMQQGLAVTLGPGLFRI